MFLYKNFLYYNPTHNPDGTLFELPNEAKLLDKEEEDYINGLKMEDIVSGNIIEKWKHVINNILKYVKLEEPNTLILFKNYLSQNKSDSFISSKFNEDELTEIGIYLNLSFALKSTKLEKVKIIIDYLNNNK